MVWAPDSRRLFVATDTGKVAVVDRNTGQVGDLGLSLPFGWANREHQRSAH